MMRYAVAIIIALAAVAIAYFTDLTKTLGAHPFWANQVLIFGALGGTIIALISQRINFLIRIVTFITLTFVAAAIAYLGKTRFAASYAEDAFAGQMWFFGWHAICIFAVATLITGTHRQLMR